MQGNAPRCCKGFQTESHFQCGQKLYSTGSPSWRTDLSAIFLSLSKVFVHPPASCPAWGILKDLLSC